MRTRRRIYSVGIRDGKRWRRKSRFRVSRAAAARTAQKTWSVIAPKMAGRRAKWSALLRVGKRYAAGFFRGARVRGRLVPVPLRGKTAAVLYAPKHSKTLKKVLAQLRQLPLDEIVIVLHDATATMLETARAEPGALVAHWPHLPDPDKGRAMGARLTTADTVLFVDGARPVKAEELAAFLWKCGKNRLDVALNDVSPRLGLFYQRNNKYRLVEFLNRTLGRPDLGAGSLTSLPYALSRRALDTINPSDLAVPPKAQAGAILAGLRVGTGGSVPPPNPRPVDESAAWHKTAGAHAEAWRTALAKRGSRLFFPDKVRDRSQLGEWQR